MARTLGTDGTPVDRQRPCQKIRSPNSESRTIQTLDSSPLTTVRCVVARVQAIARVSVGLADLSLPLLATSTQRGRGFAFDVRGRYRRCARWTRPSHSSGMAQPATAAASGKRLVAVIPGSVFTSSRVTA